MTRSHLNFVVAIAWLWLTAIGDASAQAVPPSFDGCVDALRRERAQHQPPVRAETFERFVANAQDLRPAIRAATEAQPEFTLPIWDYMARLVDGERVADGRKVGAEQAAALSKIAERHGVEAATVVAVFGVETNYGRIEGRHAVVDATLSRACLDLKSRERKRHFFSALWLLQEGFVQPDRFRGSWAGAFGLTQFMPGTFVSVMEDGDGSGRVDIMGSAPDALATTARYLSSLGWTPGLRWGTEVTLPSDAPAEWLSNEREHGCLSDSAGRSDKCRRVADWAAAGVAPMHTDQSLGLPSDARAALLAPSGARGPAWLVTRNYQAIWQYNRADAYGLAIGLLSDALRGDPAPQGRWPTDDPGISRAELLELQRVLVRRGHPGVVTDGYDGPQTRQAIRDEERALGWPETGRAGARIARALTESAPGPTPGVSAPAPAIPATN